MPARPLQPRRSFAVVLAACALLCGCAQEAGLDSPDGGATDTVATGPEAQVGGSCDDGWGFVDWHDGEKTPKIIMGIQGGQHIWATIRVRNVHLKKLRMAVEMRLADTGELVKPGRVELTTTPKQVYGDWTGHEGMPVFVKEPCKIMGKKIRVQLEVSDLYGVKATDEAFITPTWNGYCPEQPSPPVPAPPPKGHCLVGKADAGSTDAATTDTASADAGTSTADATGD